MGSRGSGLSSGVGLGNEACVKIGGNTDVAAIGQIGYGIEVTGTVENITDGTFTISAPMQTGLKVNLGRTVVIRTDQAHIVLCEKRWEPYDLGCFTHAGIDPQSKKYILVKSRQHFRAGFEPIAKHIILAAGPGVCSSDYDQFNFENITRPIYPLDEDMAL